MIKGQLIASVLDPGVNFALVHSMTPVIDSCAVGGRVLVFHRCKLLLPETRLKIPGQISD